MNITQPKLQVKVLRGSLVETKVTLQRLMTKRWKTKKNPPEIKSS